jgi:hypothetical protein
MPVPRVLEPVKKLSAGATDTGNLEIEGDNLQVMVFLRHSGVNDAKEAARARLDRLGGKAMEVVERAVDSGDVKTALVVLKGQGLLGKNQMSMASEEPEVIARAQERAEQEARLFESLGLG